MHGAGRWTTSKYTSPGIISRAFFKAGEELEIELLEVRDEALECEFEI
jgi:hypothetical protein